MTRRGSSPQPFPEVEAAIGENPARYLDNDLLMDEDARMLFEARFRGIRKRHVAARWLEVENRLDREDCPRSSVIEKLEKRASYLDEHGDQVPSGDPGRDEPIHVGGDPEAPPPKNGTPGSSDFSRGAARHYHYITKAKPFLEARDRRRRDGDEPVDTSASTVVATDGGDGAVDEGGEDRGE